MTAREVFESVIRVLGSARASRAVPVRFGLLGAVAENSSSLWNVKRCAWRGRQARHARALAIPRIAVLVVGALLATSTFSFAQADPASEPGVIAVAKVLPAVVSINTERVVRRQVRDPFEDFYAQFFGNYRVRPREIRQRIQSLGSGFVVDPAGYIVTNQHVVERAADLKIQVTTNDGKTYAAHYITGDEKKDLAFIKIDAKEAFPFISLE